MGGVGYVAYLGAMQLVLRYSCSHNSVLSTRFDDVSLITTYPDNVSIELSFVDMIGALRIDAPESY